MKKFSSFHRFLAFIICMLTFTFLSSQSNVFAVDFPAVLDPLTSGEFSAIIQPCTHTWVNNHDYYNCDNEQNVSFTGTLLGENEDGSYSILWTWDLPSEYVGANKYIRINRITYGVPNDYISSGDTFFYSVSSSYNVFFGTGRGFFYNDTHNQYQYLTGGLNSYLWYSRWNDMYSCPDMSPDVCQFQFAWNSATGSGSAFYLSSHFTLPSGWFYFAGIDILHNSWDSSYDDYIWTPYTDSSVLYLLNTWSDPAYYDGDPYYMFQTTFYKTDTFFDLNNSDTGGTDVNDAITAEQEYITNDLNNANNSNSSLGSFSIPIFNPISSWLQMFTDNQCVTISVVPGWFGLGSQTLCSPWSSNIRSVITPVISVAGTMLLFAYAVRWLNGSSFYRGEA